MIFLTMILLAQVSPSPTPTKPPALSAPTIGSLVYRGANASGTADFSAPAGKVRISVKSVEIKGKTYSHLAFEFTARAERLPDLTPGREIVNTDARTYAPKDLKIQIGPDEGMITGRINLSYGEVWRARKFMIVPVKGHAMILEGPALQAARDLAETARRKDRR